VGRLKAVRKSGNTAHFEAMFGARTCCFSAKFWQSYSLDHFRLQSKQLQELILLGELTKWAKAYGVQVMIEGPEHSWRKVKAPKMRAVPCVANSVP